ncbi:siderophore-interacting protein [Agromyces luteolus]|uniref:Siderophore-interacting protein n=1 Tax=Agromyces luteolus TaxID=88373 RepID=A0A7C9LD88_9MICO|nr:siderophore-interacting protein [Agromyces luteolus]MUN05710.1 siderophore-interacting protein [Agromyces luteolus]GLK26255.1 siderophore-interacting protein [Agromyces luteolus]
MPFTLARRPNELVFRPVRLAARTALAPDYVRLRFEGEALRGFDSPGADDHIRVFFPPHAGGAGDSATPADLAAEALRAFPNREYTPLHWDADAGALELEFVVHGDAGVAGPWAASAPVGSVVGVGGPRGSLVLEGEPDAWFLAGDETAIPAIRRWLRRMPPGARGHVVVEVRGPADELDLDAPAGVEVRWVHRGDAPAASALTAELDALAPADRPAGDVFAFVAAEQAIVRPGRALLSRWGIDADRAVVKGYWKRGESEYHAPH